MRLHPDVSSDETIKQAGTAFMRANAVPWYREAATVLTSFPSVVTQTPKV